ncbi:MAG: peptide chain release factor-like protein [Planctomycetota bacterium]
MPAVLRVPPPHPACLDEDGLRNECQTRRLRRSGPGGQHRNKVETAIVITHTPTGVSAEANERRSQAANLAVAIQRLRVRLALQVRTHEPNKPTAGPTLSELWQSRTRGQRLAVSGDHADYPALLAEALDWLDGMGWDHRRAADSLGVSASQLVKFLRGEPAALDMLNRARAGRGEGPLR